MLNRDFFRETIRFDANGAGGAGTAGAGGNGSTGNTGGGTGTTSGTGGGTGSGANGTGAQGNHASQGPQIDYDRIQQMLDGTLRAKEETALKAYFKQQGLTQEQAQQAINDFKAQQAANTPDATALQTQVVQAQAAQRQAEIQSAATMAAVALGIDAKTIPYVLKMADLSAVVGQDGKISNESLTNALNKVLEDVPALKPQAAGTSGFMQVGTGNGGGGSSSQDDQLASIFGNKK